jgi:hypothetical protein
MQYFLLCLLESIHVETKEKVSDTIVREESHMEDLEGCVVRAKSLSCVCKREWICCTHGYLHTPPLTFDSRRINPF